MKYITLFIALVFNCIMVFPNPVSVDSAQKVAINFFLHKKTLKASGVTIKNYYASKTDSVTTTYTFNLAEGGWIIVSANDVANPILAYSTVGSINENNINPSAKFWLEKYNNQIYSAITNNISNKSASTQWQSALISNLSNVNTVVSPLLKSSWNQTQYYNNLCPADAGAPYGYNGHDPAGCVALAMSQIMYYYGYPHKGLGFHSYSLQKYGTLSTNFGNTAYNWNNIPDTATSPNTELANLIYQCGIAVNMDYDSSGSGAADESVITALKQYFNYSDSMQLYNLASDSASYELWIARIKNELNAKRPVYYSGQDATEGHAFVCDGYDNSYPTKFHFNWGWGGEYNGYFTIGAIDPYVYQFDYYNSIITGIKPNSDTSLVCRISSPQDLSVISADTTMQIRVNVVSGNPTKIIFYVDSIATDSIASMPYVFTMKPNNIIAGNHKLKIVATDGNHTSTHEITIQLKSNFWELKQLVPSSEQLSIEYISVANSNDIWATLGGKNNLYVKSSDGGNTWVTSNITNASKGLSLSNIYAISSNKAYACLNPQNSTGGAIMVTSDSGKTWTTQTSANFRGSWADWVYFFDSNNGVCMGDPSLNRFFIYATSNGGNTWNRVSTSNLPSALSGEAGIMDDFDAYGNSIWFGTTNGRIYKSSNKGLTWTVTNNLPGANDVLYVKLKSASTAIAFDGENYSSDTFYLTNDTGKTWHKFSLTGYPYYNNTAFVHGTSSTWININGSESSVSFNNDSSSTIFDRSANINDFRFLTPTVGWAGANYDQYSNGAGIYKWIGSFTNVKDYTISFLVKDENNLPLNNVELLMNNGFITTDLNGKASFKVNNYGNPYWFQATKPGFAPQTNYYSILSDTTISIILSPSNIVTFNITNQLNNPVQGIAIAFNDSSKISNSLGQVTFSNLVANNQYPYSVVSNNEYLQYGSVYTTDLNQIVNITIGSFTDINNSFGNTNSIYPNPASSSVHIISQDNINSVSIFNTSGLLLLDEKENGNTLDLSVEGLKNGLYFLQVNNKNYSYTQKLIVNHR